MLICLKSALETHYNVWPAIIPSSIDGKLGQENICESRFMPSQDSFNSSYESYNFVENTHMARNLTNFSMLFEETLKFYLIPRKKTESCNAKS